MNEKEEENWRISALMSAPEDDISLGVKKMFGDEIMKMGPKSYLLNGQQDKWLESHQQLSQSQMQSKLVTRNDKLLGKPVSAGETLSAKAI